MEQTGWKMRGRAHRKGKIDKMKMWRRYTFGEGSVWQNERKRVISEMENERERVCNIVRE